jgi:phage terminase small subunit
MSELTARQKAFVEELPKNQWNGTRAAIAAGYAEKSAHVRACRLLKNPRVTKELDRHRVEIAEKTDVEVAEIVVALRQIAFGGKKATNSEQLKALELLGKYKAMFVDRQQTEDAPSPIAKERRKEALEMARQAARIVTCRKQA